MRHSSRQRLINFFSRLILNPRATGSKHKTAGLRAKGSKYKTARLRAEGSKNKTAGLRAKGSKHKTAGLRAKAQDCNAFFDLLAIQITSSRRNKAKKVRRVDRQTNALPTDQPTDQRTYPVIEVLWRT